MAQAVAVTPPVAPRRRQARRWSGWGFVGPFMAVFALGGYLVAAVRGR